MLKVFRFKNEPSYIEEGGVVTITAMIPNIRSGERLKLKVTGDGVTTGDITRLSVFPDDDPENMTYSVQANSKNEVVFRFSATPDKKTEGSETAVFTLYAEADNFFEASSTSVLILDTSFEKLDVIVELFGEVFYLSGLKESITSDSHTVEFNGVNFNWSDIDPFVTPVVRGGEFTQEFAQEIADAYPSVAGISYSMAVALVGVEGLQGILMKVAGADGNYVG